MGGDTGTPAPQLDGMQLRRGKAVVYLPWSGKRQEGCGPVRSGALLPVPPLLRSRLRESAGGRDEPNASPGAGDTGEARREHDHDGVLPGEARGVHQETYMRLFWEHDEAEMEQLIGMRER